MKEGRKKWMEEIKIQVCQERMIGRIKGLSNDDSL